MDKDQLMNANVVKSLLTLDKMITPLVVKVLYLLLLLGVLLAGLFLIFNGQFGSGIGILLIGTLWVRIICEGLLLVFSLHEKVAAIAQDLKAMKDGKAT